MLCCLVVFGLCKGELDTAVKGEVLHSYTKHILYYGVSLWKHSNINAE